MSVHPVAMKKRADAVSEFRFGAPDKIPCITFPLPAIESCATGARLARVPGSTCSTCYAYKRGRYLQPIVIEPRARNLAKLRAIDACDDWVERFVGPVAYAIAAAGCAWFRWHDSGDIISAAHLSAIVDIADLLPEVRFWLPTRELGIVRAWLRERGAFPQNLVVRCSAAMIDGDAPCVDAPTSTVHSRMPAQGFECSAPANGGRCGDCRACWDPLVPNVSYAKH